MGNSVEERLTIPLELPEINSFPGKSLGFGRLVVRECVPAGAGFSRTRLRGAYVNRLQEALSLPWIEKLPGEKRVRFVHGQIFVIQKYVGCELIRAHISHGEEQGVLNYGHAVRASTSQKMSFEHEG